MTLRLDHVWKRYRVGTLGRSELTAVRDVSFDMQRGEVLSLIGESGSGKSTIGKMILRLTDVTSGSIIVDGTDIATYGGNQLRDYYRGVQGVFQDPFSSFNPIFKADRIFAMLRDQLHPGVAPAVWNDKVDDALAGVRLDPGQVRRKYPHQLSGGQLQRMLVARALLLDTQWLVADEIISMLDASTRIDVLNLLAELKQRGLGVLFITHDLSLGNYLSERTMIMCKGVIVEMGATGKVLGNPQHPYSRTLVAAVPSLERRWGSDDPAAEDAGPCPIHGAGRSADDAGYVEVEPDHHVACYQTQACSADR